ncbi:hypothetical protein GJAV_G00183020 [Gymnothorax javanicus]|nr:hypothetical protein GJAV_G00183020 [Gymnothorax javanicus]
METEKQPTSPRRRGWSLSSLRIKSRSSVEDEGFDRRGAKRFFSVRSDPRKTDRGTPESGGPGAASPPIARLFRLRPTEKEKGRDVARPQRASFKWWTRATVLILAFHDKTTCRSPPRPQHSTVRPCVGSSSPTRRELPGNSRGRCFETRQLY